MSKSAIVTVHYKFKVTDIVEGKFFYKDAMEAVSDSIRIDLASDVELISESVIIENTENE